MGYLLAEFLGGNLLLATHSRLYLLCGQAMEIKTAEKLWISGSGPEREVELPTIADDDAEVGGILVSQTGPKME